MNEPEEKDSDHIKNLIMLTKIIIDSTRKL